MSRRLTNGYRGGGWRAVAELERYADLEPGSLRDVGCDANRGDVGD
jgi:hypothetical protein